MYALQPMLSIRSRRRDLTQTALATARSIRAKAVREHEEKVRTREDFDRTKEARRDAVYAAVMGRLVSLDDLDQARSAVTRIDEEGLLLQEAERQAQLTVEKRTEEAEHARVRFVAASKDLTKIEEHRKIWQEEEMKAEEMRSDLELEEFVGRKEDI